MFCKKIYIYKNEWKIEMKGSLLYYIFFIEDLKWEERNKFYIILLKISLWS